MARPRYKSSRDGTTPQRPRRDKREQAAPAPPKAVETLPPVPRRSGARLPERTSLLLDVPADGDYALIDSGDGEKLERYGALTIRRPEPQAIWRPTVPCGEWVADATFAGDIVGTGGDEGRADRGSWEFADRQVLDTFDMHFDTMPYLGRFTAFRHTGVFPEQAAHWRAMANIIAAAVPHRPVKMLNLFGYTGLASLVAAKAGAEVTHVDASRKAIVYARENAEVAKLEDAPIRWICDDAMKFCAREVRRGNSYDVILLDPPAYGRGPKGEVWQLFEHLPHLLDAVRDMQSANPLTTVLTSYAIRASHLALHEAVQDAFAGMDGRLESGELVLQQERGGRRVSTSMFTRYLAPGVEE